MLNWLLRERRVESCWVCEVPVKALHPEASYGSPLGGAFTFAGCPDCQERRAVTPLHAAWFACLAGLGGRETGAGEARNPMVAQTDADGADRGRPVHVRWHRGYVPFQDWVGGESSTLAMCAMRAIMAAHPEAYLGVLTRI